MLSLNLRYYYSMRILLDGPPVENFNPDAVNGIAIVSEQDGHTLPLINMKVY